MKVRTRMMMAFLLLGVVGFIFLLQFSNVSMKPALLKPMEDDLADIASLLAAQVGNDSQGGVLAIESFRHMMVTAQAHPVHAEIYDYRKEQVDLEIYITDAAGIIQYDSTDKRVGQDMSGWRDINRTLAGSYGARSTWRTRPDGRRVLYYFVSAPITVNGELLGVVSVGKANTLAVSLLEGTEQKTLMGLGVGATLATVWGLLFSAWITKPIRELTRHVESVRDGKGGILPKLGKSDIGMLGRAFEEMRDALEGKRYVEQYVQTLTHEIKSPLSAIKGAAELLHEEMPPDRRARFLANIQNESIRIQNLIDRLLELSAIESRKMPKDPREVNMTTLAAEILSASGPFIEKRGIKARLAQGPDIVIRGERFLLHLALSNLIQNALEFTPDGGEVTIELTDRRISICDSGPGIPEYALTRVFERFYSLSRPDTGKKSSGLGLSIAAGVAELHHGEVRLENREEGGARAVWTWR